MLPLAAALLLIAACWWIVCGASRWVFVFLGAALLLPPLLFPWGNAGVHPALIPAAVGLWAGVLRLSAWRLRAGPMECALFAISAALLISVPMALLYLGPDMAAQSLARLGLFAISIYLYFYLAQGPGRDIGAPALVQSVLWMAFASAAFAVVDFAFQLPAPARFAEQHVWLASGVFRRAQGVFYEASTLGTLCAFLLVLIAAILARKAEKWLGLSRIVLGSVALAALAGLLFSFSRAAVLNLVVALAAMLVLHRLSRVAAMGAGAVALVLVLAMFAAPDATGFYLARLRATGEFLLSEPNLVLSRRLESWDVLLDYIGGHPLEIITGIGYKTLPYTEHLGHPMVADNMYLSLLVETGWLGLAALLLLNATVLWVTWRQAHSPNREVGLAGTCMFAFWCGLSVQMASGDILTYWRILPVFLATLALGARDSGIVARSEE